MPDPRQRGRAEADPCCALGACSCTSRRRAGRPHRRVRSGSRCRRRRSRPRAPAAAGRSRPPAPGHSSPGQVTERGDGRRRWRPPGQRAPPVEACARDRVVGHRRGTTRVIPRLANSSTSVVPPRPWATRASIAVRIRVAPPSPAGRRPARPRGGREGLDRLVPGLAPTPVPMSCRRAAPRPAPVRMVTEPLRRLDPRVRDRQEGPRWTTLTSAGAAVWPTRASTTEKRASRGQGSALAPEPGGGQRSPWSQPDRQGQADDRLELVVVAEGCQSPVE